MNIVSRNCIKVIGEGSKNMVFAHGFGCDQNMWRYITPAFMADYKIILFDLVGSGNSDLTAYDFNKYSTLLGYANDIIEICDELALTNVTFVGHSVSSMIGLLAEKNRKNLFESLIMVGPSPCYINKGDYIGGFSSDDINELLTSLESNYLGWSSTITPAIMANGDRPELAEELANSFCRVDPKIAEHFAKVTFLSDHRDDLKDVNIQTLILQCSSDIIAPIEVGKYLHNNIKTSTLQIMNATGHCPHLSAPEETITLMKNFLSSN